MPWANRLPPSTLAGPAPIICLRSRSNARVPRRSARFLIDRAGWWCRRILRSIAGFPETDRRNGCAGGTDFLQPVLSQLRAADLARLYAPRRGAAVLTFTLRQGRVLASDVARLEDADHRHHVTSASAATSSSAMIAR